ncbi:MAG: hypothetical protein J7M26_09205 [Armatimonadetes bacterium]|nr:hypothetical protein [Armatimonadota bacterium]
MMMTLGCLALLGTILAAVPSATADAAGADKLQALRKERRELAHKRRRLIYNNDGDDAVYYMREPTAKELLRLRTEGLQGSTVDTLFYCTWSSGFGLFTHRTRVGQILTKTDGILKKNKVAGLIEQGTDPLEIIVNWCKANGVEVFWSMRMNDVHDGGYPELVPEWKKQHPEYLFGSKDHKPTGVRDGRAWTGVDYGRMAVRERAFRFIEEVCRNYDVDGIEMDFFRHPIFFKRHAWGQPCGEEELKQMTGFVRRVRKMTEGIGLQRGRPILVAVRVPDSVEYCRKIGLDLEGWLAEGLIDLLVPSGYFHLSPWQDFIELGHRYGVPVYPCLSESRLRGEARKRRNRLEVYRARALNVWRAGADGVYTFNLFWSPKHRVWRELGDPELLERLDKTYYVAYRGFIYADLYLRGGGQYVKIPTLCPERPVSVKPGSPQSTVLTIGDDFEQEKARGLAPQVALRLEVSGLAQPADLRVKVNGTELGAGTLAKDGWLEFRPDATIFKLGDNRIEMAAGSGRQVVVRDLALQVTYPKAGGK